MAHVESTYAVTATKSGKPDHTREVWKSSQEARLVLKYGEAIIRLGVLFTDQPLIAPHAKAPLAAGALSRVVNLATGIDTPYVWGQGYTLGILTYWWSFNYPIEAVMLFDGVATSSLYEKSYVSHYEVDQLEDYWPADPLGFAPHQIDFTCINEGDQPLKGYYMFVARLRAVGTPPYPEMKKVRCVHCQATHEVDRKLGKVECPECEGFTNYIPSLFAEEMVRP